MPRRRQAAILQALLALAAVSLACAAAAAPPIAGRWLIDSGASTTAAQELKGILDTKRRISDDVVHTPASTGSGRNTESRYWQEANAGREWRHSRELAHAGPLQRLLESENLEIIEHGDGYVFVYADGYERDVVPNPQGRVFTASGEELSATDFGFTLAYRDGDTLVLETRIKRGGQMMERVSVSPDGRRLTVDIEIDRRDWKWIAKVHRVFTRATGSP